MNYFSLLNIAQVNDIDLDALKKNYQKQAAENHPDNGGDEKAFQRINTAYQTLSIPHERLKHLLALNSISFKPRGTVSDSVMECFMPIGELSQAVSAHLQTVRTASSALSKALLSTKSLELQDQLEEWIDRVESIEQKQLQYVSDQAVGSIAFQTTTRNLAFLFKWRAELRQHFSSLFSST